MMRKTNPELCKTCKYGKTTSATSFMTCDYFLMTGNRRGCKLGECDKYEKAPNKRLPKSFKY